jgi:hypothetical protein
MAKKQKISRADSAGACRRRSLPTSTGFADEAVGRWLWCAPQPGGHDAAACKSNSRDVRLVIALQEG